MSNNSSNSVMAMNNAIHGFFYLLIATVVAMIGFLNGFSAVQAGGCTVFALIGVGMAYKGRVVIREMWVPGWPSRMIANMAIPVGFLSAPHFLLRGDIVVGTLATMVLLGAIGFLIWDAYARPEMPKEHKNG